MTKSKHIAAAIFCFIFIFVNSWALAAQEQQAAMSKQTRLQGSVSETVKPSPFLYGSISEIPPGVKLKLSIMGNLCQFQCLK